MTIQPDQDGLPARDPTQAHSSRLLSAMDPVALPELKDCLLEQRITHLQFLIGQLRLGRGLKQRAIGRLVGLAQSSVSRHLKTLRIALHEHREAKTRREVAEARRLYREEERR